jgi:hypothetical protein
MYANQRTVPVAEFGADPHERTARSLFGEIWARVQGLRTVPYGAADKDPSTTWNGYAAPPQEFTGLGSSLGGATPYRNGNFPTIDTGLVEGPLGDPARRIFAQRLARRTAMGGGL